MATSTNTRYSRVVTLRPVDFDNERRARLSPGIDVHDEGSANVGLPAVPGKARVQQHGGDGSEVAHDKGSVERQRRAGGTPLHVEVVVEARRESRSATPAQNIKLWWKRRARIARAHHERDGGNP